MKTFRKKEHKKDNKEENKIRNENIKIVLPKNRKQ